MSPAPRMAGEVPTPEAQDRNWARANGDRPHTFTMAFVYQLPWRSVEASNVTNKTNFGNPTSNLQRRFHAHLLVV